LANRLQQSGAEESMKKILVGVDGSPRQADVLSAAMSLGKRTGARLVLFRNLGVPVSLPLETLAITPTDVSTLVEHQAEADLQALLDSLPPDLRGGIQVAMGTAWDSICRVATEQDVDLIVIGSHGYGAMDMLLGTTAAKVVNHADRSVLVVRAAERLEAFRPTRTEPAPNVARGPGRVAEASRTQSDPNR
jgi:universal stress protein F